MKLITQLLIIILPTGIKKKNFLRLCITDLYNVFLLKQEIFNFQL